MRVDCRYRQPQFFQAEIAGNLLMNAARIPEQLEVFVKGTRLDQLENMSGLQQTHHSGCVGITEQWLLAQVDIRVILTGKSQKEVGGPGEVSDPQQPATERHAYLPAGCSSLPMRFRGVWSSTTTPRLRNTRS
jgi:hypothetical protein